MKIDIQKMDKFYNDKHNDSLDENISEAEEILIQEKEHFEESLLVFAMNLPGDFLNLEMAIAKIKKIFKLSKQCSQFNIDSCNREILPREEIVNSGKEREIDNLVYSLCPNARVNFDGDPRGYTVKINFPGEQCNTMGGVESGWGIA